MSSVPAVRGVGSGRPHMVGLVDTPAAESRLRHPLRVAGVASQGGGGGVGQHPPRPQGLHRRRHHPGG